MRTMLRLLACALFVSATGGLRADEVAIPLDKVPKAVLDTVKKRFPKAELTEAAKETDGDKVSYEVTIKDGESKIDVTLTPEGVLTMIETVIATKELPKAVTEAVEAKYPKAAIKLAETVVKVTDGKEKLAYYEVVVDTADKKTFELQISEEGKILMTEEKKEEKKEDKKDKKDKE